jgi:diguanylate cyclase (GGDEF)-like protein
LLIRSALCAAVLVGCFCSAAEISVPERPRYAFQHYGEQFGIGSATVNSMAQDRKGFLWFGAQTGLIRFDGVNIKYYGAKEGLPGAWIDQLLIAPDGALWAVVNNKGIVRFDGLRWVQVPIPKGEAPTGVQAIAVDARNQVFVTTASGLFRIDPDNAELNWSVWNKSNGLPQDRADNVYIAPDGTIWFSSGRQLGRMRGPAYKPEMFPKNSGLPDEGIVAILMDSDFVLWVRTQKHLLRLEPGSGRFVEDGFSIPSANDSGMPSLDEAGHLMVPTVLGLYRKVDGQWQAITKKQGATNDGVIAALQDREGAIWLGLSGTGIDRWPDPKAWSGWTEEDGLPNSEVWGILRDRQQRLWVTTSNGIANWAPGQHRWRNWSERDGLAGGITRDIAVAGDGAVWALSVPGGLNRFDPGSLTPHKISIIPKPQFQTSTIVAGPDGKIWIGGRDYIKKVSWNGGPVFEDVRLPKGMVGFTSGLRFYRNVLWAGGAKGLARFDGREWRKFSTEDGLRSNAILDMAPEDANTVWVIYQDAGMGVTRLQMSSAGISVKHFSKAEGMASDNGFMIGRDREGRTWVGGERGLSAISPDGSIQRYNRADGLLWDDIDTSGFWEEPDGTFMFGTSHGLSRFDPRVARRGATTLPLFVTSAVLGGREQVMEKEPAAAYHQSIDLQFASLTFRDSPSVECMYRLDGLESEFAETNMRQVRYPALPSGNYDFEIKCVSSAGVWSQPAHFKFTVRPAWWERWWARLILLFIVIFLVRTAIDLRTRALEKDRRRLEEAVAERSAALAEANRELQEASLTDPLTKTRNRRYFTSMIDSDLSQAVRAYERVSEGEPAYHRDLIFYLVDFDSFKEVNDKFGHQAGDRLLVQIGERLNNIMRHSDTLVRWGGEEFLIVCKSADRSGADVLAHRILHEIGSLPFDTGDGNHIFRTCSIGWVPFPWIPEAPDALKFEDVLHLADNGLYEAKNSGRNRSFGMMPGENVDEVIEAAKRPDRPGLLQIKSSQVKMISTLGPAVDTKITKNPKAAATS